MSQSITKKTVIVDTESDKQKAQTFFLNGKQHQIKQKMFAQWLLDEHSKLYCKWVVE